MCSRLLLLFQSGKRLGFDLLVKGKGDFKKLNKELFLISFQTPAAGGRFRLVDQIYTSLSEQAIRDRWDRVVQARVSIYIYKNRIPLSFCFKKKKRMLPSTHKSDHNHTALVPFVNLFIGVW